MKNSMIDWFKTIMVIISLIFLFLFYNYSNNGRYQFSNEGFRIILDTRTGVVYRVSEIKDINAD